MDDKNKKIVFHIANSIKGGSGKSTISFFLAAYFNKKEHCKAVIIDLDVNGSSWDSDHTIENDKNNYIQNYFYNPEGIISRESGHIIYKYEGPDDNGPNNNGRVEVYLCDSNNSFLMSSCELDLFENLIYVIIKHVISKYINENTVHIILDMPPSYEEHADRIINHLLIDTTSPMYKDFKDNYIIIHHLICASTYSHIQLNLNYLNNIVEEKGRSYSNAINDFLNNNRYHFVFAINDLHGKIQKEKFSDNTEKISNKEIIYKKMPTSLIEEKKLYVVFINKYDYLYPVWADLLNNKPTSIPAAKEDNDSCFKISENMDSVMSDLFDTVEELIK